MITLKYKDLMNSSYFMGSFRYLTSIKTDTKYAYSLSKIFAQVRSGEKQVQKEWLSLIGDYAAKTETGEISTKSDGTFDVPVEKQAEFEAQTDNFGNREFQINVPKIQILGLKQSNISLSAEDMYNLRPILFDLEVVSEADHPPITTA